MSVTVNDLTLLLITNYRHLPWLGLDFNHVFPKLPSVTFMKTKFCINVLFAV